MITDTDLLTQVLDQLRTDAHVAPGDIGVAVRDGVVTLAGEVDSLVKKTAVARVAEHVRGVRAIADDVSVRMPGDHVRTDADIARDLALALMWDTEVRDKTIIGHVHGAWIWLDGTAGTPTQREAAERAARGVSGIQGLTNLIRIQGDGP